MWKKKLPNLTAKMFSNSEYSPYSTVQRTLKGYIQDLLPYKKLYVVASLNRSLISKFVLFFYAQDVQWTKQCYLILEFSTFPSPKREGNEVGHELFDKSPRTRYQYRGYRLRNSRGCERRKKSSPLNKEAKKGVGKL